jgi:class 3 adenylate cyclase
MDGVSRWWRLRVPAPVVDAGLAVLLAVAIIVAIDVAPSQGTEPDALAYGCGLAIAALSLARRRWPVPVLLASAAILQFDNQFNYPGLAPAVPLSVALATAWAAGHRRWSLLLTAWFAGGPLGYLIWVAAATDQAVLPLADVVLRDVAMFAAVLLLGEAVRGRRALDAEHRLLVAEQERSERLLLNILPAPVAARLKQDEEQIADRFPEVTVLFADLVGYTRRSQGVAPRAGARHPQRAVLGLRRAHPAPGPGKIKTIGDAYMVAGGLPEPPPDHAEAVVELALAMREEVSRHLDPSGRPLQLRIGLATGPVVAGVIGRHKFSYDLWGDTVNTASRMESQAIPGCIQVTDSTYRRLRDRCRFERRGPVPVKGKKEFRVLLQHRRAKAHSSSLARRKPAPAADPKPSGPGVVDHQRSRAEPIRRLRRPGTNALPPVRGRCHGLIANLR